MTSKKQTTVVAAAIDALNRNIKQARDDQALLRKHRATIGKAERKMRERSLPNVTFWTSVGWEYPPESKDSKRTITVSGSFYSIDSLKSPALIKVLSRFLDADLTATKDYAASLNRDYHFWFRLPEDEWLRVRVCVYVRENSPTCRKVLVGSKDVVVHEDQYQIVCD